jgi:hypothetical protein
VKKQISAPRAPDKAETAVSYVTLDDSFFSHIENLLLDLLEYAGAT